MRAFVRDHRTPLTLAVAGIPVVVTIALVARVGWNTTSIIVGVLSGALALSTAALSLLDKVAGPRARVDQQVAIDELAKSELRDRILEERQVIDEDHAIPLTFREWKPDVVSHSTGADRAHIYSRWAATSRRRLLILGGPGSGKSDLARRFTIDQLTARDFDDRIALLFKVAEWDGHARLDQWMIETLIERYPETRATTLTGDRSIADWMISRNRVIAVLDGLDEVDVHARARLLTMLVSPELADLQFLITSRLDAYQGTVSDGAHDALRGHVSEVVIDPVPLNTALEYLDRHGVLDGDRRSWKPVISTAQDNPDSPLAQILTNPLMLSLARRVYSSGSSRPRDLLRAKYDRLSRLEDHLLDRYVETAYRFSTTAINRYRHARSADEARSTLFHLTDTSAGDRHLRTNTVSWWKLAQNVPHFRLLTTVTIVAISLTATTLALILSGVGWGSASVLALSVAVPAGALPTLSSVPNQDFSRASAAMRFVYVGISVDMLLGLALMVRFVLASSGRSEIRGALLMSVFVTTLVAFAFAMVSAFKVLEYRPRARVRGRVSTAARIGVAGGLTFGPFCASMVLLGLFDSLSDSLTTRALVWSASVTCTTLVMIVSIATSVATADYVLRGAFTTPGVTTRPIGRPRRVAAITIACALSTFLPLAGCALLLNIHSHSWFSPIVWLYAVLVVFLIGLAFGVVFAFFPHSPLPAQLRPALRSKLALTIASGGVVGVAAGWLAPIETSANRPVTMVICVVLCVLLAGMAFMVGPPRGIRQSLGPHGSYRTDLKASAIFSISFGAFAAVAFWPVSYVVTLSNSPAILAGSAVAFGSAAWFCTPSGAFVFAQLILWWRRDTPIDVMSFTRDAHARGLLRRHENSYEFRHARLQERMFRRLPSTVTSVRRTSEFSQKRSLATAIGCLLITSIVGMGWGIATYTPTPEVGSYYTSAPDLTNQTAGSRFAMTVESARLADVLINPNSVDEHYRSTRLYLSDLFVRSIWGENRESIAPFLAEPSLTSAAASFGTYQSNVGPMSMWINVLGFNSPDAANTFGRLLNQQLEIETQTIGLSPRAATILPDVNLYFDRPPSVTDGRPRMIGAHQSGKWLSVAASTQPSHQINAEFIERALSLQTEALQHFVPTDAGKRKDLPADTAGMVAHALNDSRRPGQQMVIRPSENGMGTVLGPNATQIFLLSDQRNSIPLFQELELELSASQSAGTVLRFKFSRSPISFIRRSLGMATTNLIPASRPHNIPNSQCWHSPRGVLSNIYPDDHKFLCAVPWGRYAGIVFARSEREAHLRAGAQYLLLQDFRVD